MVLDLSSRWSEIGLQRALCYLSLKCSNHKRHLIKATLSMGYVSSHQKIVEQLSLAEFAEI